MPGGDFPLRNPSALLLLLLLPYERL